MKISAIIPVYNNQTTIARVATVLRDHPDVSEVVAVNDGSKDKSGEMLRYIKGIRVVTHKKNRGKGAGMVSGWKAAKYDDLLTVDADMSRLTAAHITTIIREYETGKWDMVVAAHNPRTPFDWVSGQRMYKKSAVMPYAKTASGVGNGIEQVINFAHRDKRVTMVFTKDIGHILKYQRHTPHLAAWLYLKEGWQLAKTEYLLRFRSDDGMFTFRDLSEFPYLPINADFIRNISIPSFAEFTYVRRIVAKTSRYPRQKVAGLITDASGVVRAVGSSLRKLVDY